MHSVEAVGNCKYAGVASGLTMYMSSTYVDGKLSSWYFTGDNSDSCDPSSVVRLPSGELYHVLLDVHSGSCVAAQFDMGYHSSITTFVESDTTSKLPIADFGSGMGYAYFETSESCGSMDGLTSYFVTNPSSCYLTPTMKSVVMSSQSTCSADGARTTVSTYSNSQSCDNTPVVEEEALQTCVSSDKHKASFLHEGYTVGSNTGAYFSTFCADAPTVTSSDSTGGSGDGGSGDSGGAQSNSKSSASSSGDENMMIYGIAGGGSLVCCCIIFGLYFFIYRKKKEEPQPDLTVVQIQHPPAPNGFTPNPLHGGRPSMHGADGSAQMEPYDANPLHQEPTAYEEYPQYPQNSGFPAQQQEEYPQYPQNSGFPAQQQSHGRDSATMAAYAASSNGQVV
jgi:hypothetical protein